MVVGRDGRLQQLQRDLLAAARGEGGEGGAGEAAAVVGPDDVDQGVDGVLAGPAEEGGREPPLVVQRPAGLQAGEDPLDQGVVGVLVDLVRSPAAAPDGVDHRVHAVRPILEEAEDQGARIAIADRGQRQVPHLAPAGAPREPDLVQEEGLVELVAVLQRDLQAATGG